MIKAAIIASFLICIRTEPFANNTDLIKRELLIKDSQQLCAILESCHPDPYLFGGGRIAFHRRFHRMCNSIPECGVTKLNYYKLLTQFIANVGDGHTQIFPSGLPDRAGLCVSWGVVDKALYISGIYHETYRYLLGSRLVSLQDVNFDELVKRQKSIKGADNLYGHLINLAESLENRSCLEMLLPEWDKKSPIKVVLKDVSDNNLTVLIKCSEEQLKLTMPCSRITLPAANTSGIGFGLLTNNCHIVGYLRIDSCMKYREAFEDWLINNSPEDIEYARSIYRQANGKDAPKEINELLAGIPSATECFQEMIKKMQEKKVQKVIIDLRQNTGGNGIIGPILSFFLYGPDAIISHDRGYSVTRLSKLYYEKFPSVNNTGKNQVYNTDYDFSNEDEYYNVNKRNSVSLGAGQLIEKLENKMSGITTFINILKSKHSPYRPNNVVVLVSEKTYSAGFYIALILKNLGAKLLGTPSSQAGNCYIDTINFQLNNTQLEITVPFKEKLEFPEDSKLGEIYPLDKELTYKDLALNAFDPNTAVIISLKEF